MKALFSVGPFDPDDLDLADGVVRPEREGVLADYLDLNGPVGFIPLLVVFCQPSGLQDTPPRGAWPGGGLA